MKIKRSKVGQALEKLQAAREDVDWLEGTPLDALQAGRLGRLGDLLVDVEGLLQKGRAN